MKTNHAIKADRALFVFCLFPRALWHLAQEVCIIQLLIMSISQPPTVANYYTGSSLGRILLSVKLSNFGKCKIVEF